MYGEETFTISSSERKWINRIKKYSEQYPNDVKITHINEDGSIIAEVNKKWFKFRHQEKYQISKENWQVKDSKLYTNKK